MGTQGLIGIPHDVAQQRVCTLGGKVSAQGGVAISEVHLAVFDEPHGKEVIGSEEIEQFCRATTVLHVLGQKIHLFHEMVGFLYFFRMLEDALEEGGGVGSLTAEMHIGLAGSISSVLGEGFLFGGGIGHETHVRLTHILVQGEAGNPLLEAFTEGHHAHHAAAAGTGEDAHLLFSVEEGRHMVQHPFGYLAVLHFPYLRQVTSAPFCLLAGLACSSEHLFS